MRKKTNRESIVIGLDASTTAVKALAFGKKGEVVASARESIPLFSPQPNYYEQNPDDWWKSAKKAIKAVTLKISPGAITALAISNQRETFVPLDRDGGCIRPAIIWLDERCKDEVEHFSRKVGKKKIHRITGKPVNHSPVVYRLAWMKRNEPELYKHIHMVCDVHTYLVWKLTGLFKTSWASADPLGLFDLKNKKWSPALLSALGLHEDRFPETYRPGTILGTVSEEARNSTGLQAGTVVVAGGGDGQAAGTGVNALSSERVYLNLGTAVVAGVFSSRYRVSRSYRTMNSCSDKGYYFECSLRAGTFAIDWFLKDICKTDPEKQPEIYKHLEQEAAQLPPGSDNLFFLPYLCGVMNPYWDNNARGAFIGLASSHTRAHMYRAILEGIAFETAFALSAVEKSTSIHVQNLMTIGGGTSSNMWLGIFADISGKTVYVPHTTEASCLGAGMAASVGSGRHRSFREAAAEMTGTRRTVEPNPKEKRKYQNLLTVYKKIYPSLLGI